MKRANDRVEDQMLTVNEAAQYLGVATKTLRRWDQDGLLLPDGRTAGRHRRYSVRQLDEFRDKRRGPTGQLIRTPYCAEVRVADVAAAWKTEPSAIRAWYGPARQRAGQEWVQRNLVVGVVLGCPVRVAENGYVVTDEKAKSRIQEACAIQMVDVHMLYLDGPGSSYATLEARLRNELHSGVPGAVMVPVEFLSDGRLVTMLLRSARDFATPVELIP